MTNNNMRPPTIEEIMADEIKTLEMQILDCKTAVKEAQASFNKLRGIRENIDLYIKILTRQAYLSEIRPVLLKEAETSMKKADNVLESSKGLMDIDFTGLNTDAGDKKPPSEHILSKDAVDKVNKLGEKLIEQLETISKQGVWGQVFPFAKAPGSDYWGSPALRGGMPIRKKWVQINGHTYYHPSYASPKPWKIQARFSIDPGSGLWEKKPPYVHNRKPLEWSLGGGDVWAVSYETISKVIDNTGEQGLIDKLLADLKVSWGYAGRA